MLENIEGKGKDNLPHDKKYKNRVARLRPALEEEIRLIISDYCDKQDAVTLALCAA